MAARREEFARHVGASERRMLRSRRRRRSGWHGLSVAGMVGWAVVVPTLAGVAIGTWIDRRWPDGVSWTLMLLTLGLLVGCWNAWGWIAMERRAIERERTGEVDDEHAGS